MRMRDGKMRGDAVAKKSCVRHGRLKISLASRGVKPSKADRQEISRGLPGKELWMMFTH